MKNLIKHFKCNDSIDLMLEALNDDAGIIIDDVMSDEQLLNIKTPCAILFLFEMQTIN